MSSNPPFLPVATASVSWVDPAGANHLRVYACDGYNVNERCFDNGAWTSGGFNESANAISATAWTDSYGPHIRVYCTTENVTVEWCSDNGGAWYQGQYTAS